MKRIVMAAVLATSIGSAAFAETATCRSKANEQKLAGPPRKEFLVKCRQEARAGCLTQVADKKLAGAERGAFMKQCIADAFGPPPAKSAAAPAPAPAAEKK